MRDLHPRGSRRRALVALAAVTGFALAALPAAGAPGAQGADRGQYFQGDSGNVVLPDFDARGAARAPTAKQRDSVPRDATVRWNRFGTPQRLVEHGGFIATGLAENPVAAARQWLGNNRELVRLSAESVADLELVASNPIGDGRAVLFRQRFGGLPSGHDGLVALGVAGGKLAYVSSTLAGNQQLVGSPQLSAPEAFARAAAAVGRPVSASDVSDLRTRDSWTVMTVDGFAEPQYARLVAVPSPDGNAVPAWEVAVMDSDAALGFSEFVDAVSGEVLLREETVDYLSDNPHWRAFPAYPALDYSSTDTRDLWCWTAAAGCELVLQNPSSPLAWDVDPATGLSTNTTSGNNARATEDWNNASPQNVGVNFATPSPTRDYTYAWTNQWFDAELQPGHDVHVAGAQRHRRGAGQPVRDAQPDARLVVPPRLHRGRPGTCRSTTSASAASAATPSTATPRPAASAAARPASPPATTPTRFTPQRRASRRSRTCTSGSRSPAAFYAPCVDGDFDMSVIGHEYTPRDLQPHGRRAERRPPGQPGRRDGRELVGPRLAMEYLNEYGFVPIAGESPYTVGAVRDRRPGRRASATTT